MFRRDGACVRADSQLTRLLQPQSHKAVAPKPDYWMSSNVTIQGKTRHNNVKMLE
jgi:hypothetical protein